MLKAQFSHSTEDFGRILQRIDVRTGIGHRAAVELYDAEADGQCVIEGPQRVVMSVIGECNALGYSTLISVSACEPATV